MTVLNCYPAGRNRFIEVAAERGKRVPDTGVDAPGDLGIVPVPDKAAIVQPGLVVPCIATFRVEEDAKPGP